MLTVKTPWRKFHSLTKNRIWWKKIYSERRKAYFANWKVTLNLKLWKGRLNSVCACFNNITSPTSRCRHQHHVVTINHSWWLLITSWCWWLKVGNDLWMLVTSFEYWCSMPMKKIVAVTNIFEFSRTHCVSNIRQRHRCYLFSDSFLYP